MCGCLCRVAWGARVCRWRLNLGLNHLFHHMAQLRTSRQTDRHLRDSLSEHYGPWLLAYLLWYGRSKIFQSMFISRIIKLLAKRSNARVLLANVGSKKVLIQSSNSIQGAFTGILCSLIVQVFSDFVHSRFKLCAAFSIVFAQVQTLFFIFLGWYQSKTKFIVLTMF